MKILAFGAQQFHADGRTDGRTDGEIDMKKLILAFRNYENAPKNEYESRIH